MLRRGFINLFGGAAAWPLVGHSADAQTTDVVPPEPTPGERMAMAEAAKAFMQQNKVPGLSMAIGHSGRLVYQEAFGWADREAGEAATGAHLFRIGSISKPITSVAVFTLVEEGRLRLDDKVFGRGAVLGSDYGELPYQDHVEEVTVGHLLTHTSGGWPNSSGDPMFDNKHLDHAALIGETLRYKFLAVRPGHAFAYSNFGYCVLGRVIEKIASQPYADFVHERVLSRCGISGMAIAGNTLDERRNGEAKYYGQNGQHPYWENVTRLDSCGGWIATAVDLVQFAMHVGGFAKPDNILKLETIATMTAPSAQNSEYAKGWAVNEAGRWWHGGSLPGSTAILVRTNKGFCWAALANTRDKPTDQSVHDLLHLLRAMVGQVSAWHA